ncbi:sodium/proton antiporter, CPA1 family [Terriglobus roseus]|uniref:Sodium/proton antiporter, CPA1 family n=1 Tax=Terriglobus roseus TaxID=392734 RepID=A0A1G7EVK7_9BACT|nr:sodium/proton antiporter, CPA1 family [Terriglobus roseus]
MWLPDSVFMEQPGYLYLTPFIKWRCGWHTRRVNLHVLQSLLLGLLIAIALIAGVARRLSVSYPIVLVMAGLLASFLPVVPDIPLSPSLVFLVFLPPLLFAAAWQTSWTEFKYNIISISSLAIGLVFFTATGVAIAAHYFLPEFDWRIGFLLGAVVSPTDAVAATSIARKIGMPKRIVDILEGESLLNDATGLLALEFGVDMLLRGSAPTLSEGLLRLLWLFAGGVGAGLLCGKVVVWFESYIDDGPVEIAVSFIVAYGSYLTGEAVHASGVIAVVVCGLFMSRKSATFFSPGVRLQITAVWDAAEFLLNGMVFLLLGMQIQPVLNGIRGLTHVQAVLYGLSFAAVLIALRLLWCFPMAGITYGLRHRFQHQPDPKPSARSIFVIGWTGMRGVVALAAANSLPYQLADGRPFHQRNMIIFLTFCVILVTLVLQGLSLPALLRVLRLQNLPTSECDEGEARRILIRSAVGYLTTARESDDVSLHHAYDDLLHQYEHRLESIQDCGPGVPAQDLHARSMQTILAETYRTERQELIALRDQGRVDESVYRTLERELDLDESRLQSST